MLQPHGVKVEARPEELTTVKLVSYGQEGSFLGIVKDAYLCLLLNLKVQGEV